MEAHAHGADFSAALKEVRVPELLVTEAQDYWKMFGGMQEHRSIAPRADLFENIWAEVGSDIKPEFKPVSASRSRLSESPAILSPISIISSPNMKQLFSVAGALGALVLDISSDQ